MTIESAEVISIHVGMPQDMPGGKPWNSGFLKAPVTAPLWLGKTNLDGDAQADLIHHGGPDKAVCVYATAHYPYWRQQLQIPELQPGDFAENFTLGELTEADVCIGDVWSIGEARVQISQARRPCWKLARRWDIKDLALQVQQTGLTGWYLRVLVQGNVQAGQRMELIERSWPQWTITAANQLMHHDKDNREQAAALAAVPELSESWKTTLTKRVQQGAPADESERLGTPKQRSPQS